MPKVNMALFAQQGDFNGRWTNIYMTTPPLNLTKLSIDELKWSCGSGRYFLEGVGIQNSKSGTITIDLNISASFEYFHINIFGESDNITIPGSKYGGAGDKTKGAIYCVLSEWNGDIKVKQSDKDFIDGKLKNVSSCNHPDKAIILQDVGRILSRLFQGCKD